MSPLVFAAFPAAAEMFGADYAPCGDRPDTLAVVGCVDAEAKAWGRRLNAAHAASQKRIDAGQRDPLRAAQRL